MKKTRAPTSLDATELAQAIHALGDYAHVAVRAERGHLNVYSDDFAPVARLTPLGLSRYQLGFRSHTGRWQPMPFIGTIARLAGAPVTTLAPYLERVDFTDGSSESHH